MINWVTICDVHYAARALCLLRSMERWSSRPFVLIVICCDEDTFKVFDDEENAYALRLSWIEEQDPRLLEAKRNRSWLEYLWTLPSVVCSMLLGTNPVIYLDADIAFFHSYDGTLSALGFPNETEILIIPHHWTPKYEKRLRPNGIFNVSMVAFAGSMRAGNCAEVWAEQCLDWCYNRIEGGKFADQRYLDDWPKRWRAHAVECPSFGLAPWNQEQYQYRVVVYPDLDDYRLSREFWIEGLPEKTFNVFNVPCIETDSGIYPIIFYHFHELKTAGPDIVKYTNYPVHPFVEEHIYKPYAKEYENAFNTVAGHLRN